MIDVGLKKQKKLGFFMNAKIPRRIDDPLKLLIWDIRDVLPLVLCIMLGILTSNLGLFFIVGCIGAYANQKFRDRRQDGWGIHFLYWIGLWPSRNLPNPFIRRYLP